MMGCVGVMLLVTFFDEELFRDRVLVSDGDG